MDESIYLTGEGVAMRRARREARERLVSDLAVVLAMPEGSRFMEWLLGRLGLGRPPGATPVELQALAHELIRLSFASREGCALAMLANLYAVAK